MLKLWIVGAYGQIGSAINEVLDPLEMEVFNTDIDELDITDTDEVLNFGSDQPSGCDHQLCGSHRYRSL